MTEFFTDQLDLSLLGSGLAALIAVISLLQSRITAKRQNALQSQDLLLKFDEALRQWGDKAIEAIALLEAATYQKEATEFSYAITKVSAMIDQGRLLLPNTPRTDGTDRHKHEAYKGARPIVLDNLFAIYDFAAKLKEEDMGPDAARSIFHMRRAFVAELVLALDTKRKKAVFTRLDETVRSQLSAQSAR